MSSFKQILINAIIKVTDANPSLDRADGPTHDESRDAFIALLMTELFPEGPVVSRRKSKDVVADAEVSPPSEKKKRGPMSDEAKAAMKAKRAATLAAKKAEAGEPEVVEKSPKSPKSPKSKKTDEPEVAAEEKPKKSPKAKKVKDAESSPKKVKDAEEKPKKAPKAKKPEVAEDANLQKIDPTWRKHLKKAAGDKYTKEQESDLLTFLNKLDRDAFDAKRAEDHIKEFLGATGDDEKVGAELLIVDFNGAEYFVNPETKRVYTGQGEYDAESEQWTSYKAVGYAGMAAFADMELDE